MSMPDNVVISIRNVSRSYKLGKIQVDALRDVSLDIMRGEFIVILGPSGSGKTTLLNLIGGIDSIDSGTIMASGLDITAMNEHSLNDYRRNYTGFIFQFFNLIPTLTALENVEFAAELVKNSLDPLSMLSEVGLKERANHFPSELSGGEQQRVAIARAMVKNPSLLLCDEPTGNLDFETGKNVLKFIRQVNLKSKKTVVLVTHNTVIGGIADRVVRVISGQIVETKENHSPISPEDLRW
jgi:putative ABC transport system ATP-binding protein